MRNFPSLEISHAVYQLITDVLDFDEHCQEKRRLISQAK